MNITNHKQNLQIGYKSEKRNTIPKGWSVKRIKELSNVLRGASPRPISDPKWFSSKSNIGWVRISDVTKSKKTLNETEQYVSKEGMSKSRLVKKDNIIMSICATVGKPIYTGFDVCIHDGFVVFDNLKVNKEYFYYLLESIEKRWKRYGQTGSQMNLNSSIVGNEKVVIPVREDEQQKIADILSTWDRAIELKEKLIEQKKQLKKGLMQKLLTGEVRLPGFDGEWEEVNLGELIEQWSDGGTPPRNNKNYFGGEINWVVIDDIKRYIVSTNETLTSDGLKKSGSKLWEEGTVILSTGASIGEVGIAKKKMATKQGITGIRVGQRLYNEFLRYWLIKNKKTLIRFSQGSSIKEIRTQTLSNLKISLPSLEEQKEISKVLIYLDDSIELLKNELEHLKLQKKGLMQLLLTGKVRVKV